MAAPNAAPNTAYGDVYDDAPIDADFETSPVGARTRRRPARRNRNARLTDVIVGCILAAGGGAIAAIAVSGSDSGGALGPLLVDIAALKRDVAALRDTQQRSDGDLADLRAHIAAQAERIAAREAGELAQRDELSALAAQLTTLVGATPSPTAIRNPLGALIERLDQLEKRLAADAAAPQTTAQLEISFQDISTRLAALDAANAAIAQRLEGYQGALARPAQSGAPSSLASAIVAADPSRMAEALARLHDATLGGAPFASQQGQLASLAPLDPDIAALAPIARAGAPNAEQIRRSFERIAREIAAPVEARTADDGLLWLRTAFTGAALERRDTLTSILAVRRLLARDDLRAAAATALPPAFAAWRETLRRRIALDVLLERLHARGSSSSGG